nr:histone deacetylase 14 [Tanacetum cinerariifolium]
DENVPVHAPTRSDNQILPFAAWVPIGKSNFVLDLQKKQWNLIFQISVDIMQNTNFFRVFITSASVSAIYIQQFWNTLSQEANTRAYRFQLDEDWFTLDVNLLRLRYPVLQMLWGIVTRTNVDYAELMWEEFVQAIQTFRADKTNLGTPTTKGKKTKPHVILYCRFTKLIICYLGRNHNIHQRSGSPLNLAEDDLSLGNLKFVPKGEIDEVFGMQILKELITNNIRNAPYYNAYLEVVAKHDLKIAAEKGTKTKSASKIVQSEKLETAKQSKPAPAKKPKTAQEKPSMPSPAKKVRKGKVSKVHKGKSGLQLIDKEEQTQPEPETEPQGEDCDLERAIQINLHKPKKTSNMDQYIFQRRILVTEEASTRPSAQPEDDISANIVCDTPYPTDAETGATTDKTNSEGDTKILHIGEEQGKDMADKVNLEEKTNKIDEVQAGSDPCKNTRVSTTTGACSYGRRPGWTRPWTKSSLEASMKRANRDEFLAENDKSRKRRRDDQDPPPPPPDSDLSKKKRHDSDASGLIQPPAPYSYQDPNEYKLLWQTGDMSSFINWYCKRIRKKKLSKEDLEGIAFKDREYLVTGKERRSALSISKLKAAYYPDFGLEELVPSLWIESEQEYDISAAYDYTIVSKPRAVIYRDRNDQKKMMRETENMVSEDDRRRSKDFMEVIERRLKIRRIFQSLESFVSGRLRDVDYRLI